MTEFNGMRLDLPQMNIKAPAQVTYPKHRSFYQDHKLGVWVGIVVLALIAWVLLLCNHAYLLWQISGFLMKVL